MKTSTIAVSLLFSLALAASAASAKKDAPGKTKAHQELDELGAKIDAFAARAQSESEETRARLQKRVDEMRAQQKQADASLQKLEAAGASAGKDLRTAFQSAYKKLKDGYRDAMKDAPWSAKPAPAKKKSGGKS